MGKLRFPARRAARGSDPAQRGFTLVELLVVISILLLVIGAILDQLASAQQSEVFASDRADALDQTRESMDMMTKDLRQATSVDPTSTATWMSMTTYVEGNLTTVTYSISGTNLIRQIGSDPQELLQKDLASTSIFTYEPSASQADLVSILLEVQPERSPETTVQMSSEVRLRNIDTG